MHCSRGKINKGRGRWLDGNIDKIDNKLDMLLAQAYRVATADRFTDMLNKACLNIYNRLLDRFENADDKAVGIEIDRIQRWIRSYEGGGLALTLYFLSKAHQLFAQSRVEASQEYLQRARDIADRYIYAVHIAQGRLFQHSDVARSTEAYINCIKQCQDCILTKYGEEVAEDIKTSLIVSEYRLAALLNQNEQGKSKVNGCLDDCLKNTAVHLGKKHPIVKMIQEKQKPTKIQKSSNNIYRGAINIVDGSNNLQGQVNIDYDTNKKHLVIQAKYQNKGRKNKAELTYPLDLTNQKLGRLSGNLSWLQVKDWRIIVDKQQLNRVINGKKTQGRKLWLIDKSQIFAEDESSDSYDSQESEEEEEQQQEVPMRVSQAFSKHQQSTVL